ncbi:hypothetical protein DHEL01_v205222 [Diaporthe helianthi]|uniref:NAD dependent epimerase/dehydratase n=1 Tax=Diaporthe helianthi TaxID=158607 RepID=A0A2P5I1I6_DIAHE|nr:hypothetical protein DHEL01_v205222 [Diaporthe helianthi]
MAPQILVLGMPRTGTQSIGQALGLIGYKNAYHMTTVGPHGHHDKWVAGLEAKFEGKGPAFAKEDFDEIFEGFDVASDIPSSIFYQELMTAYPEAHIILTTRNEDAWFESMSKTLHIAYVQAKAEPSKLAKLYHEHLWGSDFLANGRAAFRQHNEGVLSAARQLGREVLVFDPSMGWESLCPFLGKSVPSGVEYPHRDMWAGYKRMLKEVEAGRLTEDAVRIGSASSRQILGATGEGIKSAYIYTQQKENDTLRSKGEGIKSAYIYTQQKENDTLRSKGEGIKSAYIYTQQKENDILRSTGEGIKSAYIYTQQKENDILHSTGEGIKSAYIYTQQREDDVLRSKGEGIKSVYIYTQQREEDILRSNGEGIKSAYIYTQQKEDDILRSNGEGIKSAYIYTQQREHDILRSTGEGLKAAYIYTQ